MAAPTFGATPVYTHNSATIATVSRPACSTGDLLVMQAVAFTGTIPTPTGWTSLVDLAHGPFTGARAYVFYKIAGASEPSTYSLTGMNNTEHDFMVSAISGVDTTTPIHVSATATTSGNTTTPTCPTVTTTKGDTLLLHMWWLVNPTSGTPPGGETKQWQHVSSPGANLGGLIIGSTITQSAAGASGTSVLTASPTATTGNVMASIAIASTTATAPTADFTGTPVTGTAPLSVAFTDTSTGTPTTWAWDFGDGSTSTSQNPTHSYTNSGVYTVSLTATNASGSNTKTRTAYITVSETIVYASGGGVSIY